MIAWHKADKINRFYIPLKDNKKIALPRYYKDKIYTESERKYINEHLLVKQLLAEREATPADDTKKEYIRIKKFKTKQKHQRLKEKL